MSQEAGCLQKGEFRSRAQPQQPLCNDRNCPYGILSLESISPWQGQGNRWIPGGTNLPGKTGSVLLCRSSESRQCSVAALEPFLRDMSVCLPAGRFEWENEVMVCPGFKYGCDPGTRAFFCFSVATCGPKERLC